MIGLVIEDFAFKDGNGRRRIVRYASREVG